MLFFLDADEAESAPDAVSPAATHVPRSVEEDRLRSLIEMYAAAAEELERAGDPALRPLMRELFSGYAKARNDLAGLRFG